MMTYFPRLIFPPPTRWRERLPHRPWTSEAAEALARGLRLSHLAHLPLPAGGTGLDMDGESSGAAVRVSSSGLPEGFERPFPAADSPDPGNDNGPGEDDTTYHIPVLEEEVVEALSPAPGKLLMDGTLGGGGHTRRLLRAGAYVLALDQDPEALAWASQRLEGVADHLITIRSNFAAFPTILEEAGLGPVLDGILLDLGVSSHQLDAADRGFSFMREGPLDMRMDPSAPISAADLVNGWPEEELARIFYEYGDEKASRRVAKAIVKRRAERLFETTADLAAVVGTVIPKRGPASPATRVFQALRIAVNDEMGVLEAALESAHRWLKPGGRLAVITFHSLEDRLVKRFFRKHSDPEIDRPEWPAPRPNPDCYYRLVTRKGITASEEETRRNPRSRSATLRVVERLP